MQIKKSDELITNTDKNILDEHFYMTCCSLRRFEEELTLRSGESEGLLFEGRAMRSGIISMIPIKNIREVVIQWICYLKDSWRKRGGKLLNLPRTGQIKR
jgi:hypothetical protein